MLYGCEWLAVNNVYLQRIDALDQWCLQRIIGIRWHDSVRNADVHHMTNQPPLSSIVESRRLSFFGHIARMDENADASQVILSLLPRAGDVRHLRPPGRLRTAWMKTV